MATNLGSTTKAGGDTVTAAQNDAIRLDIIKNAGDYENSTGSANAYLLSIDAQYVAYTAGDKIRFQANFGNTGAATIDVNGLGVKSIKKKNVVALVSGDIEAGQEVVLQYDGTNFQMMTESATSASEAFVNTAVSGKSVAVSSMTAAVTVQNTTTETTIDTGTVPADLLGAKGTIEGSYYICRV